MKKTLLSLGIVALSFGAFAQLNDGDGYNLDNLDGTSNCFVNTAPNNGGIMAVGGAFTATASTQNLTANGLVLETKSSLDDDTPVWFPLPAVVGDQCKSLFDADNAGGLDMTNNTQVKIYLSSDTEGAVLDFYLGGLGQYNPSSSTYNTGGTDNGTIEAQITIDAADEETVVTLDFAAGQLGGDFWTNWVAKSTIQSYGFHSRTAEAIFTITKIEFGSVVTSLEENAEKVSFEVYPNPAQSTVNFNYEVNGVVEVELSNSLGTAVSSTTGTSLDVSELPAGIYFATLKVNGVATAVQRVQVQ